MYNIISIMPSGSSWFYFFYVNLAFVIYVAIIYYFSSVQEIKNNWPQYRCNPLYMPLSDDIKSDFIYCVQNSQSSFMGYLLQPITYITSSLTSSLSGFADDINNVREMVSKIRDFNTSIIQNIFGVFLNIVIEFQKIMIAMKDLMGKSIGTMATFLYILDGSIMTMNSAWNGPTGQTVKTLGKCFSPETNIKLYDTQVIPIASLKIGDKLENGATVLATMELLNYDDEPFYEIKNFATKTSTYVTGSHMIYNPHVGRFVRVDAYPFATKTEKTSRELYCLITDTHKIKIGDHTYGDYTM